MALAINCVSSVPAEPTTVPAMIIAALPSTKPSKPTARPVRALYSEITTGMSAPPMGSVMLKPSSNERHRRIGGDQPGGRCVVSHRGEFPRTSTPATAPARISRLIRLLAAEAERALDQALQFAERNQTAAEGHGADEAAEHGRACRERQIVISSGLSPYNSTAAIAAAAPPPMPL